MKTDNQTTAEQVKTYSARIGADPLLVQGAGGNVSWKDGEVLWVKASGTWLAHAEKEEIFVPVDLAHLRLEITKRNFSATPILVGNSSLRPSIETFLHALMPHKVVVHLHAVEILAHLVRENSLKGIKTLIGDTVDWVFVAYFKPGADLAKAVSEQLATHPDADVVFLKSHGVVIGGADVNCIDRKLEKLLSQLKNLTLPFTQVIENKTLNSELLANGYVPCDDTGVNQLATKVELASRLQADWALYPDHVVFLGKHAVILGETCDFSVLADDSIRPNFVFVTGQGVYESKSATDAHKAQLRCYYDVLVRQAPLEKLSPLNSAQVAELLNLDAEKYRQKSQSKKRGAL